MSGTPHELAELLKRDPRFPYEAYEFVLAATVYAQRKLFPERSEDRPAPRHITARQLLDALCDLAVEQFGRLAPVVLQQWGIRRTDDVGDIVFNLIAIEAMSKTDQDSRSDFADVFDLHQELARRFRWQIEED